MPISFMLRMDPTVVKSRWADRQQAAFDTAGKAWVEQMRQYPPKQQGAWPVTFGERTGSLAGSARYVVDLGGGMGNGNVIFLAAPYAGWLLFGTGLYGPYGTLIYPRKAGWSTVPARNRKGFRTVYTKGGKKGVSRNLAVPTSDGGIFYIKYSRGSIWEGKLDEIKRQVEAAFKQGITQGASWSL